MISDKIHELYDVLLKGERLQNEIYIDDKQLNKPPAFLF